MKKLTLCLFAFCLFHFYLYGTTETEDTSSTSSDFPIFTNSDEAMEVEKTSAPLGDFAFFTGDSIAMKSKKTPSPHIFHNMGRNLLHSFAYNYGANFIGSGVGTWAMIETGLDWKWRNIVFDNRSKIIGDIVMPVGGFVPMITPVVFYVSGKSFKNEKAVIAASALTQSLLLTVSVQSTLKMITGRRDPGLIDNKYYQKVYGEEDFSNVWNWFNMDYVNGWPSGHTANAFAAAATLSEIYHDNVWVKVGAYTYATFIGLGTTTNSHWISEVFAGALMGYAIGKTVGKSYRKFTDRNEELKPVSFYCTPSSAGIIIRW